MVPPEVSTEGDDDEVAMTAKTKAIDAMVTGELDMLSQ
jgi:hypothetical protein